MHLKRDVSALILAGGKGTRLRPLTDSVPKPMLPFNNKPMILHIIDQLGEQGIDNIIVSKNREQRMDLERVVFCDEKTFLGTAAPIKRAQKLIKTNYFYVINCDIKAKIDFNMKINTSQVGTILITKVQDWQRYGVVKFEGDVVKAFCEKPKQFVSNYINAGVYFFNRRIFEFLDGSSIERDVFPKLADQSLLGCKLHATEWADVGTLEGYLKQTSTADYICINSVVINCVVLSGAVIVNSVLKDSVIGWLFIITDSKLEKCIVGKGRVMANEQLVNKRV